MGLEEQGPMETSYKTGVLWVSALQAVLANEVLRMEAMLAIVNPWDIPDPAERDPLWDVLQDWEICGAGKSRTPWGRPTRLGFCGSLPSKQFWPTRS